MTWQAKVYHSASGELLAVLRVWGRSMRDAEDHALSVVSLMHRANPAELLVRNLAQLSDRLPLASHEAQA